MNPNNDTLRDPTTFAHPADVAEIGSTMAELLAVLDRIERLASIAECLLERVPAELVSDLEFTTAEIKREAGNTLQMFAGRDRSQARPDELVGTADPVATESLPDAIDRVGDELCELLGRYQGGTWKAIVTPPGTKGEGVWLVKAAR